MESTIEQSKMRCPKCGQVGLVERIDRDGSIHHSHPTNCAYLMVWTPRLKVQPLG